MLDPLTPREIEILRLISQGMTNNEIAQILVISSGTVKAHNHNIYHKLGVSNRTQALRKADQIGVLETPAAVAPVDMPPPLNRAPPSEVSSFVGRQVEIARICEILAGARLVTLTGTGGVGKTRLALRVMRAMEAQFADGIFFVDLAPIQQPENVLHVIARVLHVRDSARRSMLETLQVTLAHMNCLLVIDNFEHVISAAPVVTQLLTGAPRLKVLATSREALNITGEQQFPVPSLNIPEAIAPVERIAEAEAVQLFVRRAQAIRPDFTLNEHNAPAIAEICHQLDGLPLAIELAAVWTRLFSPATILEHLSDPAAWLSTAPRDSVQRHRTLYNAITWSYDLLSHSEKTLFHQLAVFRGGASLEAIGAICDDFKPLKLINTLNALADKSLVVQYQGADDEPRFRLLVMIREYAHDRLLQTPEAEQLKRRHARFFFNMAQTAARDTRHRHIWFRRLEQDNENLNLSLRWLLEQGDCTSTISMAVALFLYWLRQNPSEGVAHAQAIFAGCGEIALENSDLNYYTARLANNIGAKDIRRACVERLTHIAHSTQEPLRLAQSITLQTIYQVFEQDKVDFREIRHKLEHALGHYQIAGDVAGIGWVETIIGLTDMIMGDYDAAAPQLEAGYRQFVSLGEMWLAAGALQNIALNNMHLGRLSLARDQFIETARDQWREGTYDGVANALVGLAGIACERQNYPGAVHLLLLADAILTRFGLVLDYPENRMYQDYKALSEARCAPETLVNLRQQTTLQSLEGLIQQLPALV